MTQKKVSSPADSVPADSVPAEFRPVSQNAAGLQERSRTDRQNMDFQDLGASGLAQLSLRNVVENYIQYYAGGTSHTGKAKRYDLQHFVEYAFRYSARGRNVTVNEWTLLLTKDFLSARQDDGDSPATISRRLATLKHLGRTLAERVPGFINPAREARSPKFDILRPDAVSPEDLAQLRQAARLAVDDEPTAFSPIRNLFLLELLLGTGLRADEVRRLRMNQVSSTFEWLNDVQTKGKRFRRVYIDTQLRKTFATYLEMRRMNLLAKAPAISYWTETEQSLLPVLISIHRIDPSCAESFGLDPKTIWRIISNLGNRAQAASDTPLPSLHPHKLRHTFAHGLLASSNDIRLVAQALGHSDVRTTMRYTERSDDILAQALEDKRMKENVTAHVVPQSSQRKARQT